MYNWNTNTTELRKYPEKFAVWRLEQLINFGLNGEKLSKKELIKYWNRLRIDPKRKKLLQFWLWQKRS